MQQNNWALKEFNIDATKDIEAFLKEAETNPYFHNFIEIMKKTQDPYFCSLLYGLIPAYELRANVFSPICAEIRTIFNLKEAYEAFESLVYYLIDDECLTLAEIDYDLDYSFSFQSGTKEEKRMIDKRKLYVLCTGLWNTSLSPYAFFYNYLDKEVKSNYDESIHDMYEVSKVNKIRYHCFNTLGGVKDFTSFTDFLYEKQKKMVSDYDKEVEEYRAAGKSLAYLGPSYFERCGIILNDYLDSTITREAAKDGCDEESTSEHRSILAYISLKSIGKEADAASHAWRVAENTANYPYDDRIYIVALLHDVVEDGYTTFEKIQKLYDLDAEQMEALNAITRQKGERYFDYIQRVKANKIAKIIKLADLQDNIARCAGDLPNYWGLLRRYAKAYGILIDEWKESKNESR